MVSPFSRNDESASKKNTEQSEEIKQLQQKLKALAIRDELFTFVQQHEQLPKLIFNISTQKMLWANKAAEYLFNIPLAILLTKRISDVDQELFTILADNFIKTSGVMNASFNYSPKRYLDSQYFIEFFAQKVQLQDLSLVLIEFLDPKKWEKLNKYIIDLTTTIKNDFEKRLQAEIRERKEVQTRLSQLQAQYSIFDNIPNQFFYSMRPIDKTRTAFNWVSKNIEAFTGYTVTDIDSDGGWRSVIIPSDIPGYLDKISRAPVGKMTSYEYRILSLNGKPLWVRDYFVTEVDDRRQVITGIAGVMQNITAEKLLEEKAAMSKDKPASVSPATTTARLTDRIIGRTVDNDHLIGILAEQFPIQVYHDNGVVLHVNSQFESILGFQRYELMKRTLFDFVLDASYKQTIMNVILYKHTKPFNLELKNKNGETLYLEGVHMNAMFQGRVVGLLMMRTPER